MSGPVARRLSRRVDAVAVQINTLHVEFLGAAKRTLDLGIKIGGLLALKKEGLGHGEWLPWVERNLHFTDRTASNYMRLWKHRAELKKEPGSDLTSAYRLIGARPGRTTPNVPALRSAVVSLSVRQIRHGIASGLRRLAKWIDAK